MKEIKKIHIALDNGSKNQKFVYCDSEVDDFIFESGMYVSADEPVSNKMTVKFKDRFYTVGSGGRIPIQVEKSMSEDSFIFSLAGFGHFMCEKGINELQIILSVGLPILHYTDQRQAVKKYFDRSDVLFDYEDSKGLKVSIKECFVWPQGYSGFLKVRSAFINTDVIFADLGGFTCDCGLTSRSGLLDPSSVISMDLGMIQLYKKIQAKMFRKGLNISEGQIDQILLKENPVLFDDDVVSLVNQEAQLFVDTLIGTLSEQFELKMNVVYFLGGASITLKDYISSSKRLRYFEIEESITSNADGYLALTKTILKKRNDNE